MKINFPLFGGMFESLMGFFMVFSLVRTLCQRGLWGSVQ